MKKMIDLNINEYMNIEEYLNDLKLNRIDIAENMEIHELNLNHIRAFMIRNMRSLGFRYQELEQYFKRHFPDEYENDRNEGIVYVIERK